MKSPGADAFRKSLYALTGELAALQVFLTAPEELYVQVRAIEGRRRSDAVRRGDHSVSTCAKPEVVKIARRFGRNWLIALINEESGIKMGAEVSGLDDLNGMEFTQLYGDETQTVHRGEIITRLMPYEVKVFVTGKNGKAASARGGII